MLCSERTTFIHAYTRRIIIIIIMIILDTRKWQFIMCKSCGKNALGLPYKKINEFGYGSHRQGELCLGDSIGISYKSSYLYIYINIIQYNWRRLNRFVLKLKLQQNSSSCYSYYNLIFFSTSIQFISTSITLSRGRFVNNN